MKPIHHALVGALALVLAACVPQPRPTPSPQARPTPTPVAAPAPVPAPANWADAPQTHGDWTLQLGSGFTVAAFADGASEPRFALRCNLASRQISLVRPGLLPASAIRIATETRTADLPAQLAPGAVPALVATLAASDRLFDAMALSKGRFAVEVAGAPTLYLPSWAEVTRVIEDCR